MTDQNNAAQAAMQFVLTDEDRRQLLVQANYPHLHEEPRAYLVKITEELVLSKLRAEGVQAGDERALFEWHNRACELTRDEDVPEDYRNSHVQAAWESWRDRAALASAPVAGEPQPVAWRALWTLPTPGVTAWHDTRKVAPPNEAEMLAKGYSLQLAFSAPQASAEALARYCPGCGSVGPVGDEYRDCCPDGNQARMIPARLAEQCRDTFRLAIQPLLPDAAANDSAAPQASESVRILFPAHLRKMWSGGEVQAWLDNHQGITPPKPSAKGSLERYMDWKAEQAEVNKDPTK